MSPEAQRIAIAQACGWRCLAGHDWIAPGEPFDARHSEEPPDYLNDLNAIHEAEEALTAHQRRNYPQELAHVCGIGEGEEWTADEDWTIIHATAAQRAEAFLRTLGKWVES